MHYAKFNKDVAKILQHDTRGIDCPDTHKHSNQNIDRSRTHLNYDLKDRGGLSAYQYQQKLIDEIKDKIKARGGKAIRKDAVTLCSWVVTAPKDLPKDKQKDFFKGACNWFADRYGEKNIVTAVVHLDEVTPHLHLDFVPIVYDKKKGFEKLCARNLETPKTLAKVHKDLQEYLKAELGCEVNLLNGATVNGNKNVAELKLETTLKKISEAEKSLDEKKAEAEKFFDEKISEGKRKLDELNEKISEAKKSLDTIETVRDEKLFEKGKGIRGVLEKVQGSKRMTAEEQAKIENLSANLNEVVSACERKSANIDKDVEERAEILYQKKSSSDRKGYSEIINRQKKTNEEQIRQIQQLQQQLDLLQREQRQLSEYREFYSNLEECLSAYPEIKEIFRETGLYDEFEKLGDCQEKEEINYNF